MRLSTVFLLLGLAAALGACGSTDQDPLGVGRGTDALKQSPCACGAPFYRHGQWVS
jgi:hypothetical protein